MLALRFMLEHKVNGTNPNFGLESNEEDLEFWKYYFAYWSQLETDNLI